jgi:hypothetical protein
MGKPAQVVVKGRLCFIFASEWKEAMAMLRAWLAFIERTWADPPSAFFINPIP